MATPVPASQHKQTNKHHTGKKFIIVVAASDALFMMMRNNDQNRMMMKWISFPGWFGKSPEKMVSGGRRTKTISNALPHWYSRGGDDTDQK